MGTLSDVKTSILDDLDLLKAWVHCAELRKTKSKSRETILFFLFYSESTVGQTIEEFISFYSINQHVDMLTQLLSQIPCDVCFRLFL